MTWKSRHFKNTYFSEQREPFDGNQEWDWGRWASEEYALLVAEEEWKNFEKNYLSETTSIQWKQQGHIRYFIIFGYIIGFAELSDVGLKLSSKIGKVVFSALDMNNCTVVFGT